MEAEFFTYLNFYSYIHYYKNTQAYNSDIMTLFPCNDKRQSISLHVFVCSNFIANFYQSENILVFLNY